MILKNVRYVLTAHFEMTNMAMEQDNESKFSEMIRRRLMKGQYYHKPYLGVREFPAEVRLVEDNENAPLPISESRTLGLMLYDIEYVKDDHGFVTAFIPTYFMAEMKTAVVNLRNAEVLR